MTDTLPAEFPAIYPADWKRKIIEELKGKSFDDLIWHTKEGFDVQPFYTAEDLKGIKSTLSQKRKPGWEIRQDFVVKDLKKSNAEALSALTGGAEGIGFDLSKIDITKSNLQKLLKGINYSKTPIHFSGVKMESLEKLVSVFNSKTSGSVQLSDFSVQELSTIVKYAVKFPAFDFITLSCKADSVKSQVAEIIKEGTAILQQCSQLKIPPKRILPAIRFSMTLSADYFMEIAKLRALRALWAKKVNEFASGKDVPIFIHAENIQQKPEEGEEHYNILRATTIAMAGIAGGCDSLTLSPSPIPGKSKVFSERVYRNIQLLLKYETELQTMNDFGSGSYFIESLTKEIIEKVGKK